MQLEKRERPMWLLLILALSMGLAQASPPTQVVENKSFPVNPGDTIVVQNDYGRVRVSGWDQSIVEVRIRKIALDDQGLSNVAVISQQSADKIFLEAFFYEYRSESVYLDIRTPYETALVIWGANPAVELSSMKGKIRVHTLTGFITAENVLGSTSMITEDGSIIFRSTEQPSGDIRLETGKGNIACRITDGLNLRSWLRAGKVLSWNKELELSQGSLERQVGIGGPLLFAFSSEGNVTIRVETEMKEQSTIPTALPPATRPGSSDPSPEHTSDEESRRPGGPPILEGSQHRGTSGEQKQPSTVYSRVEPTRAGSDVPAGGGYSLKVNVDLVYVNASVRNRSTNRAVPNLIRDDFEIYEDGVRQQISKFSSTEAPFNLLLLLDVSGSTKSYIQLMREASVQFTQLINPNDRISLVTFNEGTRMIQEFTNNRHEIRQAIRRIRPGGGTAFYDALHRSVARYMDGVEGRKAIVVFSDGEDNQLTGDVANGSTMTFRDLYRVIQEADTLIYTIFLDTEGGFTGPGRRRGPGGILADIIFGPGGSGGPGGWGGGSVKEQARHELELIADQTGGRMYAPNRIGDLSYVYSEIANDLRMQYTLGYTSSNMARNGKWREIQVKIRSRRDLAVRARRGYFADRN